jgi:hypothetical protein
MDVAGVEGRRTNRLLAEHKLYISEAMNAFFDKKLLERVGFAEREDLVKVPPADVQPLPSTDEPPSDQPVHEQPQTADSDIVTTEAEKDVYEYVKRRLPFLIERSDELYRKLDDVNYRDYKGTFTVSYKQDRKGRLLNFREGVDGTYRFEFPESGEALVTNELSDIDDMLLSMFMRRVEELG